jgi:hypothetical protein
VHPAGQPPSWSLQACVGGATNVRRHILCDIPDAGGVVDGRGGRQAGSRHDESPELEAGGLKAGGGHRLCNLARRKLICPRFRIFSSFLNDR